jgi:hypothetical protein
MSDPQPLQHASETSAAIAQQRPSIAHLIIASSISCDLTSLYAKKKSSPQISHGVNEKSNISRNRGERREGSVSRKTNAHVSTFHA